LCSSSEPFSDSLFKFRQNSNKSNKPQSSSHYSFSPTLTTGSDSNSLNLPQLRNDAFEAFRKEKENRSQPKHSDSDGSGTFPATGSHGGDGGVATITPGRSSGGSAGSSAPSTKPVTVKQTRRGSSSAANQGIDSFHGNVSGPGNEMSTESSQQGSIFASGSSIVDREKQRKLEQERRRKEAVSFSIAYLLTRLLIY